MNFINIAMALRSSWKLWSIWSHWSHRYLCFQCLIHKCQQLPQHHLHRCSNDIIIAHHHNVFMEISCCEILTTESWGPSQFLPGLRPVSMASAHEWVRSVGQSSHQHSADHMNYMDNANNADEQYEQVQSLWCEPWAGHQKAVSISNLNKFLMMQICTTQ